MEREQNASPVVRPPVAQHKGRVGELEQFFLDRYPQMASERGSIDLTALFTALGGALSAVTVFMQTAGLDQLSEGPKAKLKVAAVTVVAALAGVIVGNGIGTAVQDRVEGLAPAPELMCVDQPLSTRSDRVPYTAEGYLQIGPASAQTRDTVMPLPKGIRCAQVKTVRAEMNIEALAGDETGACINLFAEVPDAATEENVDERLLAGYVTQNIEDAAGRPLVVLPVMPNGDPIACGDTDEVHSRSGVRVMQTDGLGFGG